MLNTILKGAAFAAGFTLSEQTKKAAILELITELRPRNCGKKLIRIGGEGDGGYLLPNDLEGIQYCFSPGVGSTAGFENDLANSGMKCFLADASVNLPPVIRPEFTFDRKFIRGSQSENSWTLEFWIQKYIDDGTRDLLLQMDIEGGEYEVILSTPPDVLSRFRIMVIEFHDLHRLFHPSVFKFYKMCFEKILKDFYVVHIHPNNCCGSLRRGEIEIPRISEFSFYNKKRVDGTTYQCEFPHPLDRDNNQAKRALPLPDCWFRQLEG